MSVAITTQVIVTGLKNWRKVLIGGLIILLIPVFIASIFVTVKTVPAVDDKIANMYMQAADNVSEGKSVQVDYMQLIAIDAVRFKQDFSKASLSEATALANRFIAQQKQEIKYDFNLYKSTVNEVNSKYDINIDWRQVVAVDSVILSKDFSKADKNYINSVVQKFVKSVTTTQTKTIIVFDPENNTKQKVEIQEDTTTYSVNSIADVLKSYGKSVSDIPSEFKNYNNIKVDMIKETKIIYTLRALSEVEKDLRMSNDDINSVGDYLLNSFVDDGSSGGSATPSPGTEKFISLIKDDAEKSYPTYKVFPSVTIAQAILESGSGGSVLASRYKNLFGIKAYNWNGPKVEMVTGENYNDKIFAYFRVYSSWDDSIIDHGKFLNENSTYTNHGVFRAGTCEEQAKALQDSGYATVKDQAGNLIYARMLIQLINQYDLKKYDTEAIQVFGH